MDTSCEALSSSGAESARAVGEKYAVPLAYGSAEELARSEEADLVVVPVKVSHHRELIRPALEAGKMVFSEWSLGADLAQAEELADLVHRRSVVLPFDQQLIAAPVEDGRASYTDLARRADTTPLTARRRLEALVDGPGPQTRERGRPGPAGHPHRSPAVDHRRTWRTGGSGAIG
ncbi:Gfo/Idh/MocA family oxidoreductase [Streptomyces fodineus]|uniref:Gfo/Idh/MocA family oxidoreductase n=1 Tax=Streptomyces fodineus TaxID=1904616 RepID=UPI001D03B876|nr:Gfo/Idh/MocA family oxidoreductase [Streptomyces fodineus]